MFYFASDQEGLAWLLARDDSWGARAAAAYAAARERGDDEHGTTRPDEADDAGN
jgi:hypothetical protein